MRKNVPSVSIDDTLVKVIAVMKESSVWGLPVVDKGKLAGIITDGDIINAFYLNVSSYSYEEKPGVNQERFSKRIKDFHSIKVKEAMTYPARTVHKNTGVDEAATQLKRYHIKRMVVVDDDGKLMGMVERLNIVESILNG